MKTIARTEWVCLFILCASVLLVFGFGSPNLGFYYEDSGFMVALTSANLSTFWGLFIHGSVPGRNLYVVWQGLLYKLVGNPASHLMALHVIQSFLDSVIVAVFFVVLRRLGASPAASFIAAGLFAFWPTHGETHYWTPGTPYNLSNLFLLLFILTSIRVLQSPGPRLWVWILDGFFFASALFTYDQLVIFIGLLLLLRMAVLIARSRERALAIVAQHSFHLAIAGIYFLEKVKAPAGQGPVLTRESWLRFWPNAHQILLQNFGIGWLQSGKPLYDRAAASDLWLSTLAAIVVTAISIAFLKGSAVAPMRSLRLFAAGVAFFVLTYLPVVLWYLSRRHNFLPSIGLFAAVAALIDLFFFAAKRNAMKVAPVLAAGFAVFFFAAMGRGESRLWETSFAAKRQLYADLTQDIQGAEILVLQDFPVLLGPAEVILPHDALFGPKLVYKADQITSFRLGDVSSSPAHEGIFLHTETRFYSPESISYYATNHVLIARFVAWLPTNRFACKIMGRTDDPTYQILDSEISDFKGPFAVDSAAIMPQGGNAVLSLDVRSSLPPTSHLAMTLSVEGNSGFEEWGRKDPDGFLNVSPVLLDSGKESKEGIRQLDSGRESKGGIRFRGRILLLGFPNTGRIRLHFLAVGGQGPATSLGDWDMPFDSSRGSGTASRAE